MACATLFSKAPLTYFALWNASAGGRWWPSSDDALLQMPLRQSAVTMESRGGICWPCPSGTTTLYDLCDTATQQVAQITSVSASTTITITYTPKPPPRPPPPAPRRSRRLLSMAAPHACGVDLGHVSGARPMRLCGMRVRLRQSLTHLPTCKGGYARMSAGGPCARCPPGSVGQDGTCRACPDGHMSTGGDAACVDRGNTCAALHSVYSGIAGLCMQCPRRQQPAPDHKYTSRTIDTACGCSAGAHPSQQRIGKGGSSTVICVQCPEGSHKRHVGFAQCADIRPNPIRDLVKPALN